MTAGVQLYKIYLYIIETQQHHSVCILYFSTFPDVAACVGAVHHSSNTKLLHWPQGEGTWYTYVLYHISDGRHEMICIEVESFTH